MKFAVLLDRYARGRGGAEVWLERFADAVHESGHSLLLATRDRSDPRAGADFDGWARVRTGPGPRFTRDRAFARLAHGTARDAGADATLGIRHVRRCDVYQPHGGVHRAVLEATLESLETQAARAARRAARTVSPKQRTFLDLERAVLGGGAGTVIALSRRVHRDLERWFPAAAETAAIIPPGVDLERFQPAAPRKRGPVRALFLARQPGLKGLGPLLRALALARAGGVDLHLTAAGGFREGPWARRAERLGVAEAVTWHGSSDRPQDLYRSHDFLAHPTFYDPCSLVVLESWARGRPVVTTEANGAAQWMLPGAGITVADAHDVESLAAALANVADAARRPESSDAARASAEAAGGVDRLRQVVELLSRTT